MNPIMNPECAASKHHNCDETGLDIEADMIVACPCVCHREELTRS